MTLHPYLTPDLQALIRTAEVKTLEDKFEYSGRHKDTEWLRLGFEIDFRRGKSFSMISYHSRPIKMITLASGHGSGTVKRRVQLSNQGWRELFIQRFNEVLHDCENRAAAAKAMCEAIRNRENSVTRRKSEVLPLLGELPPSVSWYCENRQFITEKMFVETGKFTPEQIKQIVDLIRSFNP